MPMRKMSAICSVEQRFCGFCVSIELPRAARGAMRWWEAVQLGAGAVGFASGGAGGPRAARGEG